MRAFMKDYQESKKQGTATRGYWEERRVAILYQSPAIISVQFDASFYLGGAHPQYAATFTSFNATTGATITLDDVLVAGYRPRLTRIAETVFRTQAGIKPGATLHDAR